MPTPYGITAEASLDLFGGLDTEIAPPDCPEGISPALQDMEFTPGDASSRRALRRLYPPRANTTVTYCKTFLQPNGNPLNLILYSDGVLFKEDPVNAPGVLVQIATVTPGARCMSVTVRGREFMAFSDGLKGTDVPRQYDGQNFDRLSQNGPGAPPACADFSTSGTISGIAVVSAAISSITAAADPGGATATLTVTTSAAHGVQTGQVVEIAGVSAPIFNGSYTVTGVPSTTVFNCTYTFTPITANAYGRVTNVAELAFGQAHNLRVGDTVLVSSNPDSTFNGIQTIASVPSSVQFTYSNSGPDTNGGGGAVVTPQSLGSSSGGIVVSGATITMSARPSNVFAGDSVQITNSEASDSTFPYDSNTGGNPASWLVTAVNGATITISVAGIAGLNGSNGSTTGGTAVFGGLSSAGQYQCVQFFITRGGYLTVPSPPVSFTSLGNQKIQVSDLAIGPPDVIARGLAFTASGGDNFFYLPTSVSLPSTLPGGQPVVIGSTVVPDNTTTTVVVNFSDNALLAATGIDIPGNNLFAERVLGPCVGVFGYASRLMAWGDPNGLQNLLNMGFDGGYISSNVPTGWTVETPGGALVTSDVEFGFGWQVTGDGTGSDKGRISQSAYQDRLSVPILLPKTAYTLNAWLAASGQTGSVVAEFYSAGSGVLASATIALSGATAAGKFFSADFSAATPAVVPSDTLLRVYAVNQTSGQTVTIDELAVVPALVPQNPLAVMSYVNNEQAFDNVTGMIGPADDPSPLQRCSDIRGTLAMHTAGGLHTTNDIAGTEPSGWTINQVSMSAGALSPWAVDTGQFGNGSSGEQFDFIASRNGLYIFWGAEPQKISQEIQTIWNSINWDFRETVWVLNDPVARRVYCGLPVNGAQAPNTTLCMDYRELNSAQQIADSPPVHISFTGKMIASDLTRKWSQLSITANCGALLALSLNLSVVVLGGGNGRPPGASGFGNCYQFGDYFSTDDDYGQINPFYWTYGFVSREMEQQLEVGGFLKLYPYATLYATGVGTITLTPAPDAITNAWPAPPSWPLNANAASDIQIGLNVSGERCFFKVSSAPLPGQTDNGFRLQKMVVGIRSNPTATAPMAS